MNGGKFADDNRSCYWFKTITCMLGFNPLTAVSRGSGYKLFVTRYRQPAFRIEHYMQKRAVSRCYG